MRELKLIETFTVVCGLCFSDMYASLNEALLNEAQMIIDCGVEGLRAKWSSETVASFQDSAKQCCGKLQENLLRTNDEQLFLMRVRMESMLEIVQKLNKFAKEQDDDGKQYLELVAYHSDPRLQSLILSRLDQIEKGQSGNKGQSKEGGNEVDRKSIPPTVSAESKAGPKIVKEGKSSKKSKKK